MTKITTEREKVRAKLKSKMKQNSRQISMADRKADIFAEYQRLKRILAEIHELASACSRPKSKPTAPQPSNDIENSASAHAINFNVNGSKDVLARVKRMPSRSIRHPSQSDGNAKDQPHSQMPDNQCILPVIRLNVDKNIPKRGQKVKQQSAEQPLRRTSRLISKPDRFMVGYLQALQMKQRKTPYTARYD